MTMTTPLTTLAEDTITRWWLRAPAATEFGKDTDSLYMWLFWFCVAWFVLLMGLMCFWVVKYRRRPGKIAEASSSHNTPLEIAWTIIPTLFLVYIFFRGFSGYLDTMIAPAGAIDMDLIGKKWSWELKYPKGAVATETTVIGQQQVPVWYIPAGKAIRLKMVSNDVIHAFWVPDFRVKQDVMPNRYTSVWFKAADPSGAKRMPDVAPGSLDATSKVKVALSGVPYEDHWVFCAEYCGDMHSEMAAIVRVIPEAAWNKWIEAAGEGSLSPEQLGELMWKTQCASCHTVSGDKNTGPTWKDLYGSEVALSNGSTVLACDDFLRESIVNPQATIVKGYEGIVMPSFAQLSNERINGIIAYMRSISAKGGDDSPCNKTEKK